MATREKRKLWNVPCEIVAAGKVGSVEVCLGVFWRVEAGKASWGKVWCVEA